MSENYSAWKILQAFLAGGGSAALCALRFGPGLRAVLLAALLCVFLAVSITDLSSRRIPDCLVLAALVISALSVPLFPQPGLGERILGIFSVSLPLLGVSLMVPGAFGGGDIKLLAACGLLLGWHLSLQSFVIAIFAAGLWTVPALMTGKAGRRSRIALGPFLCLGMTASIFLCFE